MLWVILLVISALLANVGYKNDNDGLTIVATIFTILFGIIFVLRMCAVAFWI